MPEFFYLFVDHPTLIVVPIVFFAALALWSRSRTAWLATVAWNAYLVYELGMKAGEFCTGDDCVRRTPLYFAYPLLAFLSMVALIQVYVRIREKRQREQLAKSRG
jgi:hypothetical protein